MTPPSPASGLPEAGEATATGGALGPDDAQKETVAPGLVREAQLMADGRRITYYRRVRQ